MIRQFTNRFGRAFEGVSAVEFALVVPILLIALLGVVDIGRVVYQRADMEAALRAGTQYFMNGGDDLAKAEQVVNESWTTKPQGVSVVAQTFCQCGGSDHACNTSCSDNTNPASYNSISVSASFPGILMGGSYAAQQSVRVR